MTEKLLQYIWQFQYFNKTNLQTSAGEPVAIVFPGTLNTNEGPDFKDAKIKIGDTLLAGSVELHLKTSEWKRHGHEHDPNYNNVILHVVLQHDELFKKSIPLIALEGRIANILLEKYEGLMQHSAFIPCAASIVKTKPLTLQAWKERLLAERLLRKANNILQVLAATTFNWEETCWRLLARNFGITVNADAFEQLATALPINIIAKYKNQMHQVEALLFGQANMLEGAFTDKYATLLQREYQFLKTKHSLKPITVPIHFMRMRPGNFPSIRLAQLAMLLHSTDHIFSKIIEAKTAADIKNLFQITANDYWHYRYRFDEPSAYQPKKTGKTMIDNIIINTVVPLLFAYGLYHGHEEFKNIALQFLTEVAPEQNNITTGFVQLGLHNKSAFDAQALLELKNEYCNHKRCLQCAVGNALLKGNV